MSFDDNTLQEVAGGRMRRYRPKPSIKSKPKVNKKALLRKRLMKHFGGFFEDTQDPPPPMMSPPMPTDLEGGRRRRGKSPVRAKSPVCAKSPVRAKRPVRHSRARGGQALNELANFFGNNLADPSLKTFADGSSSLSANTGQAFGNFMNGISGMNGGKKRRSASPTRRPVRRAASPKPKRRAAPVKIRIARAMRSMF